MSDDQVLLRPLATVFKNQAKLELLYADPNFRFFQVKCSSCQCKTIFRRNFFFSHQYWKYDCRKYLKPMKNFEFQRQYVRYFLLKFKIFHGFKYFRQPYFQYPTDHMFLLQFLCSRYETVMKKIKKDHVILLAPLEVIPQNHKKHNFLTICIKIYTDNQKITWLKVYNLKDPNCH